MSKAKTYTKVILVLLGVFVLCTIARAEFSLWPPLSYGMLRFYDRVAYALGHRLAWPVADQEQSIDVEDFRALDDGMSLSEIETALGPATRKKLGTAVISGHRLRWSGEEGDIVVDIDKGRHIDSLSWLEATPVAIPSAAQSLCERAWSLPEDSQNALPSPLMTLRDSEREEPLFDKGWDYLWRYGSYSGESRPWHETLRWADAECLVCIQEDAIRLGVYDNGAVGYRLDWQVFVLAWPEGQRVASTTLRGGNPPEAISGGTSARYGQEPVDQLVLWMGQRTLPIQSRAKTPTAVSASDASTELSTAVPSPQPETDKASHESSQAQVENAWSVLVHFVRFEAQVEFLAKLADPDRLPDPEVLEYEMKLAKSDRDFFGDAPPSQELDSVWKLGRSTGDSIIALLEQAMDDPAGIAGTTSTLPGLIRDTSNARLQAAQDLASIYNIDIALLHEQREVALTMLALWRNRDYQIGGSSTQ